MYAYMCVCVIMSEIEVVSRGVCMHMYMCVFNCV